MPILITFTLFCAFCDYVSSESLKAKEWNDVWYLTKHTNSSFLSDTSILLRTKNCPSYFNMMPVLSENPTLVKFENIYVDRNNFIGHEAIAFNIMVHEQPAIFELFLALYFRPNNFYSIHLDAKVRSIYINIYLQLKFFNLRNKIVILIFSKSVLK